MWFIEHQMNLRFDSINYHESNLPLKSEAHIVKANALRTDWADILPPSNNVYVLGNPPFAGKKQQSKSQKADMKYVFEENLADGGSKFKKYGNLDYVTAWYKKALDYIDGTNIEVAFVSTNSICQGEQVPILWKQLHERYDFYINFAHKTFRWSNEAENNAGVFVIIIGFSRKERENKYLFTYPPHSSDFEKIKVKNINSYLFDYDDVIIDSRTKPISNVPKIQLGNMANDNQGLIIKTLNEKERLIKKYPILKRYIKPFVGGQEFINGDYRYCLWLADNEDAILDIGDLPEIKERFDIVEKHRLASSRPQTRELADYYMLFGEIRQPANDYILIPLNTSASRRYIPIGFMDKDIIVSNLASFINSDDLSLFGVLNSKMHMTWVDYIAGKLGNQYRYSNNIVYNNFPFPKLNESNKNEIIENAQKILDIREEFSRWSLFDLYSERMPSKLKKAHKKLDNVVDKSYRPTKFKDDMDRMKFLFDLYLEYTSD